MNVKRVIFATLMFFTIWLATTAFSGTGRIIPGPPHLLDLNVYYNYDETDMYSFQNAFNEASRLMFNSTDGQMQFGTIRISENSAFQSKADFWVQPGAGGASTTVGGLGISGLHTTVYREQHRFTAEDGPDGDERGQFGITHELGHYVLNLYDEYKNGGCASPPCSYYCISTTSMVACIMDGGTAVHPEHHRTEWCTDPADSLSTAHVTNPITEQQRIYGEACWETIADYCASRYGITVSEPTSVDTSLPAGHVNPDWILVGDQRRYVICVDKSGSMSGSKIARAKVGADLFVDLGHEGSEEYIAVTSFSGGTGYDPPADVDFSLTEVINDTVKANARTAIGGISVENWTAIGAGMRVSLEQLETLAQDDACVEAIVLLSDGKHNYGSAYGYDDPDDVIPDLQDRGVNVYTIGLGDPTTTDLEEEPLQDIANETGGLYTHAPTDAALSTIYTTYCAEIRGAGTSSEHTGELSREKYEYEYQEAYVDEFTNEATFVLHWPTGRHALNLELERPDGRIIDPAAAAADPRIKYVQMDYYEFYRVRKPMKGTWMLWIRGVEGPSIIRYTTQTLAEAPGVDFSVFVKKHLFKYPDVPVIQASLAAGPPVAGAKVEGIVIRAHPDANVVDTVPIELYDDGQYLHGDEEADDGIYSNRFYEFSYDGSYQIHITARNETGTEATPDEPMPAGWIPAPIPPFERVSKNTIIIRGLPEEFPAPSIKTITPSEGKQGDTLRVTITGGNFVKNALVTFLRDGITIHQLGYVSSQKLTANITIDPNAILGTRDVKVTNPGGESYTARRAFTVKVVDYPIENITATASSQFNENTGPENTINGSGLDENDLHSIEETGIWVSSMTGPQPTWIQYEFDRVYKLHQMWVWNHNTSVEPIIGFGVRDATIEYSSDGTNWATLGTTHEFARAPGAAGYAYNTTVDLSGVVAKYVKITANSNWGGIVPQYGLSEVRFFYIPVCAREPDPASEATDVDVEAVLSWRAGREAATHNLYFSTDEQAVIDETISPVSVPAGSSYNSYDTGELELGQSYYWKVNEVNEAETPTTWQGDVWNFSTQEYLVVDDFEDYSDFEPDRIFDTWIDGYDDPTNGSQLGRPEDPDTPAFAEQTIVHGGKQSMPLIYDNSTASYSEATANVANLPVGQDWTKYGIQTLVLYFHGDPSNSVEQLYVKLNGSKVTYDGDAANLTLIGWQQWNIDLASFGVNLSNVTELSIGLERIGVAGGKGVVYFDDIRLYRSAPAPVTEAG